MQSSARKSDVIIEDKMFSFSEVLLMRLCLDTILRACGESKVSRELKEKFQNKGGPANLMAMRQTYLL